MKCICCGSQNTQKAHEENWYCEECAKRCNADPFIAKEAELTLGHDAYTEGKEER